MDGNRSSLIVIINANNLFVRNAFYFYLWSIMTSNSTSIFNGIAIVTFAVVSTFAAEMFECMWICIQIESEPEQICYDFLH